MAKKNDRRIQRRPNLGTRWVLMGSPDPGTAEQLLGLVGDDAGGGLEPDGARITEAGDARIVEEDETRRVVEG